MKCDEFRREFDLRLDPAEAEKLTDEMKAHLAACVLCTRYAKAMGAVDRALRAHRIRPVPPELKMKLYSIPLKAMAEDLNPQLFIRRGVLGLIGGLAVAFLSIFLPPEYQFWPMLAIYTSAYIMVFVAFFAWKRIAVSYE
jgi:hypothetical protein